MFYVVLLIAVAIVGFAGRVMWHGLQSSPRPAMVQDVRRARHQFVVAARRLSRSDRSAHWSLGPSVANRG